VADPFPGVGVPDPFTGVVYTNGAFPFHPSHIGLVDFRVPVNQADAILANVGVYPYHFICAVESFSESNVMWFASPNSCGSGYSLTDTHPDALWVYAPPANAGFGPGAPTDWAARLAANPAVDFVETGDINFDCGPGVFDSQPHPDRPYYLAPAAIQPPSYLQVEFAAGTTYDDAVAAMIGQG
jgi:hypothetical protein